MIIPFFRMAAFLPMNIPIAAGMVLSKPTVRPFPLPRLHIASLSRPFASAAAVAASRGAARRLPDAPLPARRCSTSCSGSGSTRPSTPGSTTPIGPLARRASTTRWPTLAVRPRACLPRCRWPHVTPRILPLPAAEAYVSATLISVSLAVGLNQAVVRAKVGPTLKKVLQKVRRGWGSHRPPLRGHGGGGSPHQRRARTHVGPRCAPDGALHRSGRRWVVQRRADAVQGPHVRCCP